MFCADCGAPGAEDPSASFCSRCGKRLQAAPESPTDWSQEVRYATLIQIPEVRDRIAACGAQATVGLSGEDFLKECDKVLGSLMGGIPISKLASAIVPFSVKLGLKTGKTQTILHPHPIGQTIVSVLCSLSRHSQTIRHVHQHEDGCTIDAILPSDLRSFAGDLILDVRREGAQSRVHAAANIKGQLFDWGKSRHCLSTLAADLQSFHDEC